MNRKHSGVTITELVVALSISTILLFSSGMIIGKSFSGWNRGLRKIGLDDDAAFAALLMERHIREGRGSKVSTDGQKLIVYPKDPPARSFWEESGILKADLGTGTTVHITEGVSSLFFVANTTLSAVTVNLTLESGTFSSTSTFTARHRLEY